MNNRLNKYNIKFNIVSYVYISIITILCVIPFLIIIAGSFTDQSTLAVYGYRLIPKRFSLDAYKAVFLFPKGILTAYGVTTVNTLVGTTLGLFFISMCGYVLSRPNFRYSNPISFLIYFTTIFGGGLVPWYMMVAKYLHLMDSYIALCYPGLMTPFLIILMRTFIKSSVPNEIIESAKIDSAGDFRIYLSIILPIITPGLATVGLFLGLNYWNDWFLSSMFIRTPQKYELQFYLYNMLNSQQALQQLAATGASVPFKAPGETTKLAMAVVATGPILMLYPFLQRYFIAGITIGAVKG